MGSAVEWNARHDADLLALAATGATFEDFAERMNCKPETVQARYNRLLSRMTTEQRAEARRQRDNGRKHSVALSSTAAAQRLAERDARRNLQYRDLTAAVFGDPLPGRSALDRRQGSVR